MNMRQTRLLDTASCLENYQRFIRRIVERESVWILSREGGTAYCESDDYEDTDVLLFFSDEAYARRAKDESFPEFEPKQISLFDFLYRWLPGMTADGHLAGPNWTGDLIGIEIEPYDLRVAVEDALSPEQQARFHRVYENKTKEAEGV